tara:strand:+ start:350 stop:727 length:378 start_codon:yes stop_codon:yes gene_type:complete
MEVTFEDNGSPLKKSKNRHGETCEEQLIRMCKNIADSITNSVDNSEHGEQASVASWMDGVYDIEWITHQDKTYKAARLLVAGGGPNIWVNLDTKYVEGYWGGDKVTEPFIDNLGLDDYLEELYAC